MKDISIEEKVDRAISSRSGAGISKKAKNTRRLFKLSPGGLLILGVALGAAMLSGMMYTQFFIQVDGDIELTGAMVPVFLFDEQPFTGQYYNTTADITTLDAGETISVIHQIKNDDNYAWELEIDDSFMDAFTSDPMHEWYGFNFTCVPSDMMFIPGEIIVVNFTYSLNHEFVGTDLPLDFDLKININKINAPPLAVNDTVDIRYAQTLDVTVLDNDYDYENDDLTIVSVGQINGFSLTIEGTAPNQFIRVVDSYAAPNNNFVVPYAISDGVNDPVTGYLLIHHVL